MEEWKNGRMENLDFHCTVLKSLFAVFLRTPRWEFVTVNRQHALPPLLAGYRADFYKGKNGKIVKLSEFQLLRL